MQGAWLVRAVLRGLPAEFKQVREVQLHKHSKS
jgi:hypothetical protein